MKMPFLVAIALSAGALASWPLAAATPSAYRLKHSSWGKAGVGFDQYRADSIACATGAYQTDLTDTAPGKAMVAASRMVGTRTDQESYQTANQMIGGVDRQLAAASDIQ